jgi:hypothetical protein
MSSKYLGLVRNFTARVEPLVIIDIPTFLCPVLLKHGYSSRKQTARLKEVSSKSTPWLQARLFQSDAVASKCEAHPAPINTALQLPQQCPGCGAFSQTFYSQEPGFYSASRRSVKTYLTRRLDPHAARKAVENQLVDASLQQAEGDLLKHFRLDIPQPGKIIYQGLPSLLTTDVVQ